MSASARKARLRAVRLVVTSLLLLAPFTSQQLSPDIEAVVFSVMAVKNSRTELPCELMPPENDDMVQLVLWFKEGSDIPIYTFDVRGQPSLAEGKHQSEVNQVGGRNRAMFLPISDPPVLSLESVKESDAGVYVCRVDFKVSPTKYTKVNLTVIVPPNRPKIFETNGLEANAVVGPYDEGSSLELICECTGGNPPPTLVWKKNGAVIDSNYTIVDPFASSSGTGSGFSSSEERGIPANIGHPKTRQGGGNPAVIYAGELTLRNALRIPLLTRDDLDATLSCEAMNTNLSIPEVDRVRIDMFLKPAEVHILAPKRALSAGQPYQIHCKVYGSRPPASISWWMAGIRLNSSQEKHVDKENMTASVLSLMPTRREDGKTLTCRAENTMAHGVTSLENSVSITVHYPPEMTVRLGRNLDGNNIKVGDDAYLDCVIAANPPVRNLEWTHEGKRLQHNVAQKVIMSNQTLVLQKVTVETAGLYSCRGVNAEGNAESSPFALRIKYAPTCRQDQRTVYGTQARKEVNIRCEVDSSPEPTQFKWAFNTSTAEIKPIRVPRPALPQETVSGSWASHLPYVPQTDFDFAGTVLCWARNSVGEQKIPCTFQVLQAGPPEPPENCTLSPSGDSLLDISDSGTSSTTNKRRLEPLRVTCVGGFDGGVPQKWTLELWDAATRKLLKNITTKDEPSFTIRDLQEAGYDESNSGGSGGGIVAVIYAHNTQGVSSKVVLEARSAAPLLHSRTTGGTSLFADSGMLAMALGIGVGLVAFLVCAIFVRSAMNKNERNSRSPGSGAAGNGASARLLPNGSGNNNDSPGHVTKDHQPSPGPFDALGKRSDDYGKSQQNQLSKQRNDYAYSPCPTSPSGAAQNPDVIPSTKNRLDRSGPGMLMSEHGDGDSDAEYAAEREEFLMKQRTAAAQHVHQQQLQLVGQNRLDAHVGSPPLAPSSVGAMAANEFSSIMGSNRYENASASVAFGFGKKLDSADFNLMGSVGRSSSPAVSYKSLPASSAVNAMSPRALPVVDNDLHSSYFPSMSVSTSGRDLMMAPVRPSVLDTSSSWETAYQSLRRDQKRRMQPQGVLFGGPGAPGNPQILHLQQEEHQQGWPKPSIASTRGVNLLTRIPSRESIV